MLLGIPGVTCPIALITMRGGTLVSQTTALVVGSTSDGVTVGVSVTVGVMVGVKVAVGGLGIAVAAGLGVLSANPTWVALGIGVAVA